MPNVRDLVKATWLSNWGSPLEWQPLNIYMDIFSQVDINVKLCFCSEHTCNHPDGELLTGNETLLVTFRAYEYRAWLLNVRNKVTNAGVFHLQAASPASPRRHPTSSSSSVSLLPGFVSIKRRRKKYLRLLFLQKRVSFQTRFKLFSSSWSIALMFHRTEWMNRGSRLLLHSDKHMMYDTHIRYCDGEIVNLTTTTRDWMSE